jgi:hypothetical protein
MMHISNDYLASRAIISGMDLSKAGYDKVYFETNENLVDMYKEVDFLDKDVLTVLASSDQFFLANYLGARKVYSFDKNILALYYYYMRKWTLSINKEMYPYELLDDNYIWLAKLLSKVKPEKREELIALKFWKQHLSDTSRVHSLFHDDEVDGKTIFKSINSIGSVADRENNFLNINLFDSVDMHDKCDIAMISNIPEWAKTDIQMTNLSNNLYSLLRNNGIVLCSRFHEFPERAEKERRIFEANFEFHDYGKNVGYCYIKK